MIKLREKILLVDDDKEILNLLKIYLGNEGYSILKASDGYSALHILSKETPHLVILDVMMPGIDGIEV